MSDHNHAETSTVEVVVDGQSRTMVAGITLACGLLPLLTAGFRRSVSGHPRAPLCGMGSCFECRLWVDGQWRLTCQTLVRPGMRVATVAPPFDGDNDDA